MGHCITFLGAAETVTGSRHLLELDGKRILVDCGLFQGSRELRERNWQPFAVPPDSIHALIITHAHLDHIGWLPRLVSQGYTGPIYATPATISVAKVSLPDSGRIQEEDARYLNRKELSRHKPALPLYTEADARACLKRFEPVADGEFQDLPGKAVFRFLPAGHILGSAFAEIYFADGRRILMGGDLGRPNTPIIRSPTPIDFAEFLVIESTYGDRIHSDEDAKAKIAAVIRQAAKEKRVIVVPSFSIGRTQELLYYISELQESGDIPTIPLFVDSPMATSLTDVYQRHKEEWDEAMLARSHVAPLEPEQLAFVRDHSQSKSLNSRGGPMMIIAGSGMATGGRVVHHLINRLPDPSTIILFTGFQVNGTLGRRILERESPVRIRGQEIHVRASIEKLNSLSAHADRNEIVAWLRHFKTPPKMTFIVHGEPNAQAALKAEIEAELGWAVTVPYHGERFDL